jgi:hypothetical protein
MALSPPPLIDEMGSFRWLEWFRLVTVRVNELSSVAWANIDFTGSNLTDLVTRLHNTLQTIQGGASGEYYHLTSTQHTEATATRATRGVDTTDYLVVDDSAKGVVLKSPDGHYWLVTVDNTGALNTSDLGTSKP